MLYCTETRMGTWPQNPNPQKVHIVMIDFQVIIIKDNLDQENDLTQLKWYVSVDLVISKSVQSQTWKRAKLWYQPKVTLSVCLALQSKGPQ